MLDSTTKLRILKGLWTFLVWKSEKNDECLCEISCFLLPSMLKIMFYIEIFDFIRKIFRAVGTKLKLWVHALIVLLKNGKKWIFIVWFFEKCGCTCTHGTHGSYAPENCILFWFSYITMLKNKICTKINAQRNACHQHFL